MPRHTHCRICNTELGAPFLDLGEVPLANSFLTDAGEFAGEERFPLAVCSCGECGFMQLSFVVPAERLFRDYIYVSSTSDGVRRHAVELAADLGGPGRFIVEIASNDGTVLKAFKESGSRVLGVEPALNIARLAEEASIPTIPEFFDAALGAKIAAEHGLADVILARHVFAHVDDLRGFLTGAAQALAPDGTLWIEVPYVGELLDKIEFDTIYHEHLSYVAVAPVARLCNDVGLCVTDVRSIGLHGGSILLAIQHDGASPTARCVEFLETENERRYCDPARHAEVAEAVRVWRLEFEALIQRLADEGATIIGYGAAAKGNTLLCTSPDSAARLCAILDRNSLKWDKYTPGTHIPVVDAESWRDYAPTHMLILAWNFEAEIRQQMQAFADAGGIFVVPIPTPRLVS